MEYDIDENVLVAKLDDGDGFFESLEEIISEIDQGCGVLVTAIGMITEFKLGFYDRKSGEYEWEEFEEPMELVSVNGSITQEGSMHMHAEVADENHNVLGGHLEEGKVFNVTEVTMLVFDEMEMIRKRDEELDMDLLSLR